MEIKKESTNYGFNSFTVFFFIILCVRFVVSIFYDWMMSVSSVNGTEKAFYILDALFSGIMIAAAIVILYRKMLGVVILFATSFLCMLLNISAFSEIISSGVALRNCFGLIILTSSMLLLKDDGVSGWKILKDKL